MNTIETEIDRKKRLAGLIWSLESAAKRCGETEGLKNGLAGTGRFTGYKTPDEWILEHRIEIETVMNELFDLLGIPEYKENNNSRVFQNA